VFGGWCQVQLCQLVKLGRIIKQGLPGPKLGTSKVNLFLLKVGLVLGSDTSVRNCKQQVQIRPKISLALAIPLPFAL
jgi:hypothetical protein